MSDALNAYYNSAEVAQILKVRIQTLHNWRSLGIGPPYEKPMGRVLYPVEKFNEWRESRSKVKG